ncbi:TPA: hypothetical protein DD394_08375 [bacterium UBP9_UBA11836]|nr:hypothetical protein [bacterium UBP9_UBA11836]
MAGRLHSFRFIPLLLLE